MAAILKKLNLKALTVSDANFLCRTELPNNLSDPYVELQRNHRLRKALEEQWAMAAEAEEANCRVHEAEAAGAEESDHPPAPELLLDPLDLEEVHTARVGLSVAWVHQDPDMTLTEAYGKWSSHDLLGRDIAAVTAAQKKTEPYVGAAAGRGAVLPWLDDGTKAYRVSGHNLGTVDPCARNTQRVMTGSQPVPHGCSNVVCQPPDGRGLLTSGVHAIFFGGPGRGAWAGPGMHVVLWPEGRFEVLAGERGSQPGVVFHPWRPLTRDRVRRLMTQTSCMLNLQPPRHHARQWARHLPDPDIGAIEQPMMVQVTGVWDSGVAPTKGGVVRLDQRPRQRASGGAAVRLFAESCIGRAPGYYPEAPRVHADADVQITAAYYILYSGAPNMSGYSCGVASCVVPANVMALARSRRPKTLPRGYTVKTGAGLFVLDMEVPPSNKERKRALTCTIINGEAPPDAKVCKMGLATAPGTYWDPVSEVAWVCTLALAPPAPRGGLEEVLTVSAVDWDLLN